MNNANELFTLWKEKAVKDSDLSAELEAIKDDKDAISEAFYKNLEFGTGGLRGIIGVGTNRLNIYTIGKASQGLSDYVNSVTKNGKIAIAYDSRIKSDLFARTAAEVFAANGIKVYIYRELMPTPMLSFAVRYLKCDAGVVVTASHNPSKYNGYKAYGNDGCQLCPESAEIVLNMMNKVDIFDGVKYLDFEKGLESGIIEYIDDSVFNAFIDRVESARISKDIDLSNVNVIYTPLNGSGNKPVRAIFDRIGIKNLKVVKSQELPDGNFPTCPYPNPEISQVFGEALNLTKDFDADIIVATDPDSDRVGIAVKQNGEYKLMTGNEVGTVMLNYILECRTKNGTIPKNPIAVKTIVTTEIIKKIAEKYACEVIEVLTGFKFIGEQMNILEAKGEISRYVLGFEESYGYLVGDHARDKDAVVGAMIICEMAAYYKAKGKTLIDALNSIYDEFGYTYCIQKSFTLEGKSGMAKIGEIMETLRRGDIKEIDGSAVKLFKDFENSVCVNFENGKTEAINLPKSNVVGFYLEDGSSVIVRPSGTEPKIKMYICAVAETGEKCTAKANSLTLAGTSLLGL